MQKQVAEQNRKSRVKRCRRSSTLDIEKNRKVSREKTNIIGFLYTDHYQKWKNLGSESKSLIGTIPQPGGRIN